MHFYVYSPVTLSSAPISPKIIKAHNLSATVLAFELTLAEKTGKAVTQDRYLNISLTGCLSSSSRVFTDRRLSPLSLRVFYTFQNANPSFFIWFDVLSQEVSTTVKQLVRDSYNIRLRKLSPITKDLWILGFIYLSTKSLRC